jgi:hypothetical protein
VHDGVRAGEEPGERRIGDVGLHPGRARQLEPRPAARDPDDLVDAVIRAECPHDARTDVAGGTGDDHAHAGCLPRARAPHARAVTHPTGAFRERAAGEQRTV